MSKVCHNASNNKSEWNENFLSDLLLFSREFCWCTSLLHGNRGHLKLQADNCELSTLTKADWCAHEDFLYVEVTSADIDLILFSRVGATSRGNAFW